MNVIVATMRECWHSNPNARLTTLRVKKTLAKLIDQYAVIKDKIKCTIDQ